MRRAERKLRTYLMARLKAAALLRYRALPSSFIRAVLTLAAKFLAAQSGATSARLDEPNQHAHWAICWRKMRAPNPIPRHRGARADAIFGPLCLVPVTEKNCSAWRKGS
jgi:hypothetical protein